MIFSKKPSALKTAIFIAAILILVAVIVAFVVFYNGLNEPIDKNYDEKTSEDTTAQDVLPTPDSEKINTEELNTEEKDTELGSNSPESSSKETEKETSKETEKETEKETSKETEKETEKETSKETEKETEKETSKETEKETEKETSKETEKETEKETSKETEKETVKDDIVDEPSIDSETVVIPPSKNEQTGENLGVVFPCKIPGYDIVIERLANYSGMYVENGLNTDLSNVAMLLVKNKSEFSFEYISISVEYETQTLTFDISALPSGADIVVQEKNGKSVVEDSIVKSSKALVVRKANMEMSEDLVSVKDNGNNTLTIKNLTDKTIPTVRVFYKYYMENEDIYIGGIAFTVRITRLAANGKITIQPAHYTSESCRVVMVLTYDKEV